MPRTFSLRLDDTLSDRLADVANIMGRSQADLISTPDNSSPRPHAGIPYLPTGGAGKTGGARSPRYFCGSHRES